MAGDDDVLRRAEFSPLPLGGLMPSTPPRNVGYDPKS
jgi:hypothetical protein